MLISVKRMQMILKLEHAELSTNPNTKQWLCIAVSAESRSLNPESAKKIFVIT